MLSCYLSRSLLDLLRLFVLFAFSVLRILSLRGLPAHTITL